MASYPAKSWSGIEGCKKPGGIILLTFRQSGERVDWVQMQDKAMTVGSPKDAILYFLPLAFPNGPGPAPCILFAVSAFDPAALTVRGVITLPGVDASP